MRKGFTRKPQGDEPATRGKNYITRSGLQRLKDEHRFLLTKERPAVTEVVAWAASNGDRSENADYQYGKRRLRQIDGRIRFLTKRIESRPLRGFGCRVCFCSTAGPADEYPSNADFPSGVDLNIADSILRARYRNGFGKAELLKPGQPYEFHRNVSDLAVFKRATASVSTFQAATSPASTSTQTRENRSTTTAARRSPTTQSTWTQSIPPRLSCPSFQRRPRIRLPVGVGAMTDVEETASCSAIRSDGRPIGRMTGKPSLIGYGKVGRPFGCKWRERHFSQKSWRGSDSQLQQAAIRNLSKSFHLEASTSGETAKELMN